MLSSTSIPKIHPSTTENLQILVDLFYSYGALRKKTPNSITNVASAINPKKIPRKVYEDLQKDCLAFNSDILTLYNNFDSLLEFFRSYSQNDELVDILLSIYDISLKKGRCTSKSVGLIIRNDFMYDQHFKEFQQVEFNHMACGLGNLTTKLGDLNNHFHSSVLDNTLPFIKVHNDTKQIETFLSMFNLYGNPKALFLVVMLENEANIFDSIPNERILILAGVQVKRILLSQINKDNYRLDELTKKLYVFNKEVALVYFRSLYDPTHFNDERIDFWVQAERSHALVMPDVKSFLIGIKLTQHLLSSDKLLARYGLSELRKSDFNKHLCDTKSIITDFENDRSKMLEYAKKHQKSLLLKSFKEGGMGLILGDEKMVEFIENEPLEILGQMLLSYRMSPPVSDSLILIFHELKLVEDTTSELSIYSSIILTPNGTKFKLVHNQVWDYLLRSKHKSEIKGGMNIGASFMDTLVYDENN